MSYPSPADVVSNAEGLGIAQLYIYAYAAMYGTLPPDIPSLQAFETKMNAWASGVGLNDAFAYAYVESHGSLPTDTASLNAWLNAVGARNPDGSLTALGTASFAALKNHFQGTGYPPMGQTSPVAPGGITPPTGGGTPTTPAPPAGGGIPDWIKAHPIESAAAAGIGALVLLGRR